MKRTGGRCCRRTQAAPLPPPLPTASPPPGAAAWLQPHPCPVQDIKHMPAVPLTGPAAAPANKCSPFGVPLYTPAWQRRVRKARLAIRQLAKSIWLERCPAPAAPNQLCTRAGGARRRQFTAKGPPGALHKCVGLMSNLGEGQPAAGEDWRCRAGGRFGHSAPPHAQVCPPAF